MVTIRRAITTTVLSMAAGCDLGSTTIPVSEPEIVVHAVLNPDLSTQTILLEESLTGKPQPHTGDFSSPVLAAHGIPIGGAVIRVGTPDGLLLTAFEERVDGQPTGVYTLPLLVHAGRYELTVTALGKTVTGSTTVPTVTEQGVLLRSFNRDRDTVRLTFAETNLARAYWVSIQAFESSMTIFTAGHEVGLSGDLRNLFTDNLQRVFVPGFEQTVTVAAMDTNLFDYYRSGNDPFSGAGLINHLQGGLGVFGSIAGVREGRLAVTQDSADAIDGTYTRRAGDPFPGSIELFMESRAPSPNGQDRISGRLYANANAAQAVGMLGERISSDRISLAMYQNGSTTSKIGLFDARIHGDTVESFFRFTSLTQGSYVTFVRAGK